jgi:translation elongation factor P/translation initiation factor 5A
MRLNLANSFLRLIKRNVKTDINNLKKGNIVLKEKRLLQVKSIAQHSQARSGSHYKIEYKDLKTGAKALDRVNSGLFVDVIELSTKSYQFMYADDAIHVIDPESFEEYEIDRSLISGIFVLIQLLAVQRLFRS